MTLRLVLVSLVAALGLTIPSTPMIESWVASTQNWMNARFADWDTRNPPSADYVIVSDYYDPGLAAYPARPAAGATEPRKSTVGATPSPTSTAAIRRGLDERGAVRTVSFVRKSHSFAPLETTLLKKSIVDELNRLGEGLGVTLARPASRRGFEPILVLANLPRTVVDELNARNDGIGINPPAPVVRPASRPRYEPLVVDEVVQVGVAYELNRRAEGLGITPPVVAARPKSPAPTFATLESSPNLYFAGELTPVASTPNTANQQIAVVVATVKPEPAPKPATPVVAPAPKGDSWDRDDLSLEVTGELGTARDGFGTWRKSTMSINVAANRSLESLPTTGTLFGGIAYELTRRTESMPRPAVTVTPAITPKVASSVSETPNLNRAMRLTRDALSAWVNVLTGPAIVTVSHSR